jgi:hypothetical protein
MIRDRYLLSTGSSTSDIQVIKSHVELFKPHYLYYNSPSLNHSINPPIVTAHFPMHHLHNHLPRTLSMILIRVFHHKHYFCNTSTGTMLKVLDTTICTVLHQWHNFTKLELPILCPSASLKVSKIFILPMAKCNNVGFFKGWVMAQQIEKEFHHSLL